MTDIRYEYRKEVRMNAITEHMNLATELDMSNYWMPFTANRQFKAQPRLLKRAKGMYYMQLLDEDNNIVVKKFIVE